MRDDRWAWIVALILVVVLGAWGLEKALAAWDNWWCGPETIQAHHNAGH